jgi:hypothetical protein
VPRESRAGGAEGSGTKEGEKPSTFGMTGEMGLKCCDLLFRCVTVAPSGCPAEEKSPLRGVFRIGLVGLDLCAFVA